jgi:hypothetical protein
MTSSPEELLRIIHRISDREEGSRRYEIAFSVTIHERTDCVVDLILNFMVFCHLRLCIVLSCNESQYRSLSVMDLPSNVYVNPQYVLDEVRVWASIELWNKHMSNYRYLRQLGIEYDYFVLQCSNELFKKQLTRERLCQLQPERQSFQAEDYDISLERLRSSQWVWASKVLRDRHYARVAQRYRIPYFPRRHEGLVIPKGVASDMAAFFESQRLYQLSDYSDYPLEEIFPHSYMVRFHRLRASSLTFDLSLLAKPVPRQWNHPLRRGLRESTISLCQKRFGLPSPMSVQAIDRRKIATIAVKVTNTLPNLGKRRLLSAKK